MPLALAPPELEEALDGEEAAGVAPLEAEVGVAVDDVELEVVVVDEDVDAEEVGTVSDETLDVAAVVVPPPQALSSTAETVAASKHVHLLGLR